MKYMDLDQKGYTMAEYIWIDGQNGVRSKTKVRVLLLTPTYSLNALHLFSARAKLPTEALLSGKRATRQGLGTEFDFASQTTSQWPQMPRIAANSILADRLSISPARTLKSSPNGTSTAHPAVKLQAATLMSTSAP